MRRRLARLPPAETAAWTLLLLAALVARLYDLGDRPYHHDESQIAYFSWVFAEHGDYEYNPLLHGPVEYMASALTFLVAGASDFTARLPAVVASMVLVALPISLRPFLGRIGAFAAATVFAFGPSFLYYGRFMREDILLAAENLALFAVIAHFLRRPRAWHPAALGALLALAFATKEATFITLGITVGFFVVWCIPRTTRAPVVAAVRRVGWEAWGWGVATFLVVYTLLFTTFLTDPQHWDALYEGLKYWREQHGAGRGEKEWFFYSVVIGALEWPVLALGAVGAVAALRRRWPVGALLIWLFVFQLAAYSYANERFTWLVLHPLLPLTLLAGAGVQVIWDARRTLAGKAGALLIVVCAAYAAWSSWLANAEHRANPREFLVTTQTSEQVVPVVEEIRAAARRLGPGARITIDAAEGATFPYAWYLRDLPNVGYVDLGSAPDTAGADVLVLTEASRAALAPRLADYDVKRFAFRVWWVRDYGALTPGSLAKWMVEREPWNPTGGMFEWLAIRR